jgi:hypothetical protein
VPPRPRPFRPTPDPFRWEVAPAGVVIGVLGILTGSGFDPRFQLPAAL